MLIPIMYKSGMYDMVKPPLLNYLINTQEIIRFRRTDGWVRIGYDPIRISRGETYNGPERRGTSP